MLVRLCIWSVDLHHSSLYLSILLVHKRALIKISDAHGLGL